MIDLRYVKKLIEMLDGSSVDSIEISSDKGLKIRLAKTPSGRSAGTVASVTPAQGVSDVSRATPVMGMPVIAEAPAPAPPPPAAAPPAQKLHEMKAPMVGTYYSAPEPGAKPYVSVGSKVKKGQVLCIIEAMKIMNEIESDFDGTIREVLADNAHPVEYGQVLFRIEPNG